MIAVAPLADADARGCTQLRLPEQKLRVFSRIDPASASESVVFKKMRRSAPYINQYVVAISLG